MNALQKSLVEAFKGCIYSAIDTCGNDDVADMISSEFSALTDEEVRECQNTALKECAKDELPACEEDDE